MNGNNRHAAYRRRVQRRRRIRLALILSGALLLLLFLGFLIVGNLLADNEPTAEEPKTDSPNTEEPAPLPVSVKAYPVYLETQDSSTLATRLQAIRRKEASAAAAPLNRTDGSLVYRSASAESLGLASLAYTTTVAQAKRQATTYGVRLCGIWHLDAFREKDALLRSVRIAETAAILAEALNQGIDDLLLIASDLSASSLEELLLLSEAVHRLSPKGVLGITIPDSFFSAENSAVLIDDLIGGFDFLAIDATSVGKGETEVERVEAVASANLDRLLRYNMRLILPYSDDDALQADIIAAAEQYSAKSWIILPPDP